MKNRNAFTMIELVFVIVVLGILAAIAIPRLGATRDDAHVSKGRSDVAAIRAGIISERQGRLLTGDTTFIASLDAAAENTEGVTLFNNNGILTYGIVSANTPGHWMKTGANTYTYQAAGGTATFTYTRANGTFSCDRASALCQSLTD
ncbi:MAG: prepilin-type N-terminal cleavage/methylation domain-containing protein [Campylobacterota bacterium]